MILTSQEKELLKKDLVESLRDEPEVVKIMIFGSFLVAPEPHDIDVAVFQNSDLAYLPLAMKYRKKTRSISRRIPLDILPIKIDLQNSVMLEEIAKGEIIYEK
jgi:predicted nucleotidyltransferase